LNKDQIKEVLLNYFKDFHESITLLIKSTNSNSINFKNTFETPILETWYRNNICFVGDSIHTLNPILVTIN
jgi:hypothetical protein